MQLLARNGAVTVNELREWAGLPELAPQLAGNVPVGRETRFDEAFRSTVNGIMSSHISSALRQLTNGKADQVLS